jgi:hypothetical protein
MQHNSLEYKEIFRKNRVIGHASYCSYRIGMDAEMYRSIDSND